MNKKYCMLLSLLLISVLTLTACDETPQPELKAPPEPELFTLTSSAFEYSEPIPLTYSYYGGDKSVPLSWSGAPEGTVSFVLIMDDPDSPGGTFTHWLVFNIPSTVSELAEGLPIRPTLDNGAVQGLNDFGQTGYGGPAPPSGNTHRYYFKLYALDTILNLSSIAIDNQVMNAMQGHILGEAEYMGTYSS